MTNLVSYYINISNAIKIPEFFLIELKFLLKKNILNFEFNKIYMIEVGLIFFKNNMSYWFWVLSFKPENNKPKIGTWTYSLLLSKGNEINEGIEHLNIYCLFKIWFNEQCYYFSWPDDSVNLPCDM